MGRPYSVNITLSASLGVFLWDALTEVCFLRVDPASRINFDAARIQIAKTTKNNGR